MSSTAPSYLSANEWHSKASHELTRVTRVNGTVVVRVRNVRIRVINPSDKEKQKEVVRLVAASLR